MSSFRFQDILHLPYPNPEIERDFPDRVLHSAQFAPFAALTGHDAAVEETARLTEAQRLLDEAQTEVLNRKLFFLREHLEEMPPVSVTYFVPDAKKEGGSYRTITGILKKLAEEQNLLILEDGTQVFLTDITELNSPLFPDEGWQEFLS